MIAVRRSGSSMAHIGSWTADATCSEGQVVSRGGLRGGGGEEGRGLAPVCGSTGSDGMCSWYMFPDQ